MPIITPDDYQGEINIANTDEASVISNVNWFIDEYEPIYLGLLLGDTLASELIAGLAADPVLPIWSDLAAKLKPALLRYVYWFYQNDKIVYSSGQGSKKPNSENAANATSWGKMTTQWNKMAKLNFEISRFIRNSGDYPDFAQVEDYVPFYVNGWFDVNYYYYCFNRKPNPIYCFKNSMDI